MRYAVEELLYLKGAGSLAEVSGGSRFAGWDSIAGISYASPFPDYFQGLIYQMQEKNSEALPLLTSALMNPAYPEDGFDFMYLNDKSVSELTALRNELRAEENEIYKIFTPRPAIVEREVYNFYPEYLRAKSAEALRAGEIATAYAYARSAVTCDPFDILNFRNAVLGAVAAGDFDGAAEYLDAGLALEPNDEGMQKLYSVFQEMAQNKSSPAPVRGVSYKRTSSLARAAGDKVQGVDFSRITSGASYQMTLSLGSLEFWGDLMRGSSLSQNEIDEIIRSVMLDQYITSGMLENAVGLIQNAEINNEWFTMKDFEAAALKLTGAQDIIDLYDLVMGSAEKPVETVKGQVIGQIKDAAESAAGNILTKGGKVALKGSAKFSLKLFFMFPDLLEIGVGAWQRYENVQQIAATALEKKVMLDRFYNECNSRIAGAGGDNGEWKLSFNGKNGKGATAIHNFNLWGIGGLMSEYTLKGELVRGAIGKGDGCIGNYEGILTLEIEAVDMAGSFDAVWFERSSLAEVAEVRSYFKTMEIMKQIEMADNYKVEDKINSPTVLKRTVTADLLVYISGSGSGSFSPTVLGNFDTANNKGVTFSFNHTASCTYGKGTVNYLGLDVSHIVHFTANSIDVLHGKNDQIESMWIYQTANDGFGIYSIIEPPFRQDISEEFHFENDLAIANPGTIWTPLESSPQLTIYMR
jgi:hypothetical protein